MMSSIIEHRITRTIIVFLMIGTMILPVPLFKNIYLTPLMISIARADSIPPYIGHDPISKSKAGEAIRITATIDDESDIEVWLYYMKGNDSNYKKINMNKADGKDNQFDAFIPFTDVVGERLVYFIEARDKFGNMSQAGSQSNPFTVKVEGPLPKIGGISHIPITKSGANEPIEVKAKIDNQNIIEKTTLYYKGGGESRWGNIPMVPKEGNSYQATIPGEKIKSNRLKYYIEVVDKFGNKTFSKDQLGEPFVIEVERMKVSSGVDGEDSIFKKWWFWTILLAVGGGAAATLSSDGGGSQGSPTTGSVGVE